MSIYLSESLKKGVNEAKSHGFKTTFLYKDKKIICRDSGKTYDLNACDLVHYYRYEVKYNMLESSLLFLLECPDGNKGYLISSYGTYADHKLIKIMIQLKKRNEESLMFI